METTINPNLDLEKKEINESNLQEEIQIASWKIKKLETEIHKVIVWQDKLIRNLIIALLSQWHILLEWLPWLAKTLTIQSFAKAINVWFSRIQFTPDLLPSDLIGTEIYNQHKEEFTIKKWPIFSNFILADEINRAPSKVQSALLEAMAEKQITIGNSTFALEEPFMVLATQNPIEQSGTYSLPEAQLDRFMMKTIVNYTSKKDEINILKRFQNNEIKEIKQVINKEEIKNIQNIMKKIYISDNIYEYVSDLIDATRNPKKHNLAELENYILYWVSPRWWLSIILASKVLAIMNDRDFILPEDIKNIAFDIFNHRLKLSYEAIANNIKEKDIIQKILDNVKIS